MSCAWNCAKRAVAACFAGVAAWMAVVEARASERETVACHDAAPEARLARLVMAASCAATWPTRSVAAPRRWGPLRQSVATGDARYNAGPASPQAFVPLW